MEPLCDLLAPAAGLEADCARCSALRVSHKSRPNIMCGPCSHKKLGPSWSKQLASMHTKHKVIGYCDPIVFYYNEKKELCVKCSICESAAKSARRTAGNRWAIGWVPPDRSLQLSALKRHCLQKPHRKACARYDISVNDPSGTAMDLENATPPTAVFLWALTTALTSATQVPIICYCA